MTENEKKPISILIVDDHAMVRRGLNLILQRERDIEVVGEAGNGKDAIDTATRLLPKLIIMDISMPFLNGIEATRQILKSLEHTSVLMVSAHCDPVRVYRSVEAGCAGYILKTDSDTDLIRAIREVVLGNSYFSPAVSKVLRERIVAPVGTEGKFPIELTFREAEVLQLIAEGEPNKGIADELFVSIKTVEKHRQNLMNKLGIHHIAGLTSYAIEHGYTNAPHPDAQH